MTTIKLEPRTKKNSQQIIQIHGRPIIVPSKAYKEYEKACSVFLPRMDKPIECPVEITCRFYMSTRRKVDLTNLLEAIDDILVKYGVIADDNSNIIKSHDGSRVYYDKDNPRTEFEIKAFYEEDKDEVRYL